MPNLLRITGPFYRASRIAGSVALVGGFLVIAAPRAEAQTVNIVVIGDSNVAGTGVMPDERYPAQLQAALRARELDVSVSNEGTNGEASAGTASRAARIGSGTDIVVYWQGCANDMRRGGSVDECRQNTSGAIGTLRSKGILAYVIKPPVYERSMHRNTSLTLAGEGRMIDFRDGKGMVPDRHFNGAGYSVMVRRTLEPIRKLVIEARKKKT